jgi:hypothetical protein
LVRYITENQDETIFESDIKAYLVLLVDNRSSQTFPLRGTIYLGRDKSNSVVVADQKVSRHHTMLVPVEDTFIVTDQGSANGTYLNGVLISQPTRLKPSDKITIGDTTFLFSTNPKNIDSAVGGSGPIRIPLSPPVVLPQAVGLGPKNMPIWLMVGCMGVVIIGLLLIVAILIGILIGHNQPAEAILYFLPTTWLTAG